jgi:hypothetical protein
MKFSEVQILNTHKYLLALILNKKDSLTWLNPKVHGVSLMQPRCYNILMNTI